jgi:hypothetical protein
MINSQAGGEYKVFGRGLQATTPPRETHASRGFLIKVILKNQRYAEILNMYRESARMFLSELLLQ